DLTKRQAIDRVVERSVVHRGGITLVIRSGGRVPATVHLAGPDHDLAKPGSVHRGIDGLVLNWVDLAEHQRNIRVVGNGGTGSYRWVSGACRSSRGGGGDHQ